MHLTTLLALLAPLFANALPQVSARGDASLTTYIYTIPSTYITAHPDAPQFVTFDASQFSQFSALVPVDVTPSNKIVVTGPVDVQKIKAMSNVLEGEMSVQTSQKCVLCLASCAILGVLGPEGVVPCGKSMDFQVN